MAKQKPINLVIAGVDRVTAPIRKINQRIESMQRPVRKVTRAFRSLAREARLDRLGLAVRGVGRELGVIAKRAGIFAGALSAGAAAALNRFIDKGDAIGKTAASIGIGVETLQAYRFAADRSGVSQEKLDRSFQRFTRTLGETKAGTGALKTLLDKLNPSLLRQLQAVDSTDEGLGVLFDAMSKIENQATRAALANAAFGRSGIELTNMVDSLDELLAQFAELGGAMDEATVRQAELAKDNLSNLMQVLSGIGNAVGGEVLPELNRMIRSFTELTLKHREAIVTELVAFMRLLGRTIKDVGLFLKDVVPPALRFIESIGGMKTVLIAAGAIVGGKFIVSLVNLGVAIANVAIRLKPMLAAVRALNLAFLLNPVGLWIAGIAAVIAIGYVLVRNWDTVKAFFVSMWKKIGESPLRFFIPGLGPIFGAVELIRAAWEPLSDFFEGLWKKASALKSAASGFFGFGESEESRPARPALPDTAYRFKLPEVAPTRTEVSGQVGVRVSTAPGLVGSIAGVESFGGLGVRADVGPIMTGS